ncbi:MAG: acylglycerol lipase [Streblomastix strix]|uniref:Acylglycerol lipase n=1 Tax=Streblomastix strix TaxID=222440 RepID=A0A5J4VZJ9_9EUKA|nr:MAG: acylglycerol lipase [Streblomastix strix]
MTKVTPVIGKFANNDLELASYIFTVPQPVGVVFFSHGLAEYTEAEFPNINFLTDNNFTVLALDLPGHGRSVEGEPTSVIPDIFKAIELWAEFIRTKSKEAEYVSLPKFFMGHSLGSTVGILITRRVKELLNGAIFSAPTVYVNRPGYQLALMKPASVFFGSVPAMTLDRSVLSHDQDVAKRADEDKFNSLKKITLGTGMQTHKACQEIEKLSNEDDYPFIVLHGTEDKITPYNNTEIFFDRAPSKDKQKVIIEGSYHEIHNEPDYKDQFFTVIKNWLTQHLERTTQSDAKKEGE